MDGRWKTSDEGKTLPGVEEPPPSGLRVGSEHKKCPEERDARVGRQKLTQQREADYQSDGVRRQLRRTESVII